MERHRSATPTVLLLASALGAPACAEVLGADFDARPRPTSPAAPISTNGEMEVDAAHEPDSSTPEQPTPSPDAAPDATATPDATISPADGSACTLRAYYEDRDGDKYGSAVTTWECYQPPGFVGITGDCDDGNILVHPQQTAASAQPYTPSGTTRSSYDYDCDGKEKPSLTLPPCNTNTTGWANGAPCMGSSDRGALCSPGAVYGDAGAPPTVACGAPYRECRFFVDSRGSYYAFVNAGAVPCK